MATSRILGIETSCDETSAAVLRVEDGRPELASLVILSQDIHQVFGELRALQHHAHKDKERDGKQRGIGDNAEDAMRQQVEQQGAEAEKYDVVLQEAVYINPKHDITDKVIKALNAIK